MKVAKFTPLTVSGKLSVCDVSTTLNNVPHVLALYSSQSHSELEGDSASWFPDPSMLSICIVVSCLNPLIFSLRLCHRGPSIHSCPRWGLFVFRTLVDRCDLWNHFTLLRIPVSINWLVYYLFRNRNKKLSYRWQTCATAQSFCVTSKIIKK